MPINYSRYPPNWETEIRPRILERAGHCCELCDVANYKENPVTGSRVILTIAHLDDDAENWDVTDDRLMALCQRCHLELDRDHRAEQNKVRIAAGQIELFA